VQDAHRDLNGRRLMAINRGDGKFQASYWRDATKIGSDPDDVEYSDILMELKQSIYVHFRARSFRYAAIFRWDEPTNIWQLVEEFEPRW
jgi:hypothetical protein